MFTNIDLTFGVARCLRGSLKTALMFACVFALGCTKTKSISDLEGLSVPFTFATTATTLPDGFRNTQYTYNFATSNGAAPVTYSLDSGSIPGGLTLSTAGVLSGSITGLVGTYSMTIKATDKGGAAISQTVAFTVKAPFSILTTSLPAGTASAAYSAVITAQGGSSPYTFGITSLPAGLTLNTTSGLISGSPTAAGNTTLSVTVTDSAGLVTTSVVAFSVFNAVGTPTISNSSLSSGVLGTAYADAISASGGLTPYTYAVSGGSLPAGLLIAGSTGIISGTPTATGTSSVTFRVTDSLAQTTTRTLSITVGASAPPTFLNSTVIAGSVGTPYRDVVLGSGGAQPYSFSIATGSLPAGLSLNSTTGIISGTPTATATVAIGFKVIDANASFTTQTFVMTINAAPTPVITTASLVGGAVTVSYRDVVSASGGTPSYTYSVLSGSLPPGLSLAGSTGIISGTPTATGTSNFSIRVTDSLGMTSSQALSILISGSPYGTLAIQTTSLLPVTVGQNNARNITSTGGLPPYTYGVSSGSIPTGMTLNTSTGAISGIPTATGTSTFNIQVTDNLAATATSGFTLSVVNPLTITTNSIPATIATTAYSTTVAATGGTTPYSYSATGLPTGISISSSTGIISGTTSSTGTFTAAVTVTDASGLTATRSLTLNSVSILSMTASSTLRSAVGLAFSFTPSISGGGSPFTYSILSGSLPAGLSLNSATGQVSGTPSKGANVSTGTFTISMQVADAYGQTTSRSFTMTVTVPPRAQDDSINRLRTVGSGIAYSDWVRSWGGYGAVTYSASGLPTGLSIDANSGRVNGTSTASAGNYSVVFTTTDAYGIAQSRTKTLKLTSVAKTVDMDGGLVSQPSSFANFTVQDIAHGDLNGDGCQDVAIAFSGSRSIQIGINTKTAGVCTGIFTFNTVISAGNPNFIQIADMDNDGILDVIASENSTLNVVEIYKGDGVMTNIAGITPERLTTGLNNPQQMAIADVNGDTKLDILVTNYGAGTVSVFLNCYAAATTSYNGGTPACAAGTPTNVFQVHTPTAISLPVNISNGPIGIGLVDLNGDGALDMVIGTWAGVRISTFLGLKSAGTPNATWNAAATTTYIAPWNVGRVETQLQPLAGWTNTYRNSAASFIDMNGDGNKDVVISSNGVTYVALGDGTGALNPSYTADVSDLGTGTQSKVADVNGDGYPDIVSSVTSTGKNNINVFYNNGTGQVSGRRSFTEGYYPAMDLGGFTTGATRPALLTYKAWNSATVAQSLVVRKNTGLAAGFRGGQFYYSYISNSGVNFDYTNYGTPLVGDLNGDGYPDVILKQGGNSTVFLGSATGALTGQTGIVPLGDLGANSWFGRQTNFADIDGDGVLDLASANWNSGLYSSVGIAIGVGDGSFGAVKSVSSDGAGCTTSLGASSVVFGDFNRDSKQDMAVGVGCNGVGRIMLFYGNGDGTFSNANSPAIINSPTGAYIDNVFAQDINGDGIIDLVAATRNGYIVQYQGNGDGTFTQKSTTNGSVGSNMSSLDVGDLNADGAPDFIIAGYNNNASAAIMLGGTAAGVPNFTVSANSPTVGLATYNTLNTASARFGDLDDDGKLDVVMAKYSLMGVQFLKGANDGTVAAQTKIFALANPSAWMAYLITFVDMNGDGMPDILSTNLDTNQATSLSVNLNQSQ